MAINLAELVLCHFAEIGGTPAQARQASSRISGTPARRFDRRSHALVEEGRSFGINQVHCPLDDAVVDQERLVASGNDIDNGIADAKDVIFAHALLQLCKAECKVAFQPGLEQFAAKWKRSFAR